MFSFLRNNWVPVFGVALVFGVTYAQLGDITAAATQSGIYLVGYAALLWVLNNMGGGR